MTYYNEHVIYEGNDGSLKNGMSLVVKVTDTSFGSQESILLTGDMEKDIQWSALANLDTEDKFKTTVFQLPHHGALAAFPNRRLGKSMSLR